MFRIFFVFTIVSSTTLATDWINCSSCKCSQQFEQIVANCSVKLNQTSSNQIPSTTPIDIIDLSEQIIREITGELFQSFDKLQKLILYNCEIETVQPKSFSALNNLRQIDLSWNVIETLHSKLFQNNSKLEVIKLNNNRIEFVPNYLFSNLTNLLEVYLYGNHIIEVGSRAFFNNPKLSFINLEDNQLTYLDQSIVTETSVSFLILSHNKFVLDCHTRKLLDLLKIRNVTYGVISASALIDCPPKLEIILNDTLSCISSGDLVKKLTWIRSDSYRNETVLTRDFIDSNYSHKLNLNRDLCLEDTVTYICVASNSENESIQKAFECNGVALKQSNITLLLVVATGVGGIVFVGVIVTFYIWKKRWNRFSNNPPPTRDEATALNQFRMNRVSRDFY